MHDHSFHGSSICYFNKTNNYKQMKRAWFNKHKRLFVNYPCELHGYRTIQFNIVSYLIEFQYINYNLDE